MIFAIVNWLIVGAVLYGIYKLHKKITYKKPLQLDNKSVVVITGGCDGIGRLTALDLARRYKCKLVIIDIQAQKFENLQKEIEGLGSEVQCLECDLSSK